MLPNSSVEPNGSSGQEVARPQGTSGNVTGEDSSLLLKAPSLQGTAEGAEVPVAMETRKSYCSPLNCPQHLDILLYLMSQNLTSLVTAQRLGLRPENDRLELSRHAMCRAIA